MPTSFHSAIRTPLAAALSGVGFAVLTVVVYTLARSAYSPLAFDNPNFIPDPAEAERASAALSLTPFVVICFLWFMAVLSNHFAPFEDRLFSTVFLGSGVLFGAMVFMWAAMMGALLAAPTPSPAREFIAHAASYFLTDFAVRMAAVFTLAVTTLGVRTKAVPRYVSVVGYVAAAGMLLGPLLFAYAEFIFPFWVAVFSVYVTITLRRLRTQDRVTLTSAS